MGSSDEESAFDAGMRAAAQVHEAAMRAAAEVDPDEAAEKASADVDPHEAAVKAVAVASASAELYKDRS